MTMKIHEAGDAVIADLRAQVAQLTLERDGCRDLIATLRSRVAEQCKRMCPIGLDESPQFCSAGYCDACIGRRIGLLTEELAAANSEIERLRRIKALFIDYVNARENDPMVAGECYQEVCGLLYQFKDHPDAK